MKIALITAGFLPIPATKGGAVENLVVNLLDENEKYRRMNFEIFSTYDEAAINESKKYKYSSFIFITTNSIVKMIDKSIFFFAKNILRKKNSFSYRYILQRLSYLRKCSKILKNNDYDIVLLENHPTEYLCLKWYKNYIKYNNRYYYHCHNEFPSTYGCSSIILNTKRILCVSEFRKNNVRDYMKMSDNRFSVLKNGIDTINFNKRLSKLDISNLKSKYGINKDDKILIYTGRIVPGKGIKEVIMALKKLKHKNVKLLVVGAALNKLNAKTSYEQEVEKLIDDNIIFTGFINYSDIYKYYKISDIAVLPSVWDDSAPLTVIESLVCGLPIITTDSGGIPEYATNGSAIILKRDDKLIDNIAHNIDLLLDDDKKLAEMSLLAKNVSKNFTKEKYYEDFCNQIMEAYCEK